MSRSPSLPRVLEAQIQNLTTALRPNTILNYRRIVNNFLRYIRAHYPDVHSPSQLCRDPHLLGWFRHLSEHLRNGTRLQYLCCFRRLLNDLAHSGQCLLPEGLIRSEDLPRPDVYLPKPLSPEDDRLLDQQLRAQDNLRSNTLLLLRATGMRISECLHLTPDCLRHLGQQQWALHVPLGKLHNERWVPVDDDIRQIHARLLALRQLSAAADSPFLVPQPSSHHAAAHALRRALKVAARRAGCSISPTPHQLRHSYATEMLRLGVSLMALKELLGHKDIRMTLRYTLIVQSDLQQQYHLARRNMANLYTIPPLPIPSATPTEGLTSLPAMVNSLAATRHLLSMYRRQLNNTATSRTLARLANRLAKVAAALAQLDEAQ
jgi:site-specific recombinase XerD